MKTLTAQEVIDRAGLIDDEKHHYMHVETGSVDTGEGWCCTLRETCDPEYDMAFDPEGPGAGLIEVVKDESGDWVEKE